MKDPSARTLAAGELEAVFLPGPGMLGTPLRELDLDDGFTLLAEPGGELRAAFRIRVDADRAA